MIESDSEEEIRGRGRGRVIYSSEEEEPIPTSKGLLKMKWVASISHAQDPVRDICSLPQPR